MSTCVTRVGGSAPHINISLVNQSTVRELTDSARGGLTRVPLVDKKWTRFDAGRKKKEVGNTNHNSMVLMSFVQVASGPGRYM